MLDVEGFRHRKEKINFKEPGVCTEEFLDRVSFLPPTSYSDLTTQQKQSFSWLTRKLHGIECDTGNYPYFFLTQLTQSVCLRSPGAIFYAMWEKKILSSLFECSIIDLNSLACHSTSVNYFTQNCQNHPKGKNFSTNLVQKRKPYSSLFHFN